VPDPVVPGPPASVLAQISNNPGSGDPPSNPAFTGRATFTSAAAEAFPFLPSLMTEIVPMPQSAYLDADIEVGGDLVVDGTFTPNVSGSYLIPPAVITSGTFTTNSATFSALHAGVVSTGSFTAPPSGEVVVEADVVSNVTSANTGGYALAATSTVTPLVGYIVGFEPPSSVPYGVQHLVFPVTGLMAGQPYNFDLLFAVLNAATLSAAAVAGTATVLTASNKGAPIVIAVKAV
jgi:hypothetical protein